MKQDDEMSPTEMWREVRKASQHRRQENMASSTEILAALPEISVDSRMDGVHLIVKYADKTVDFWPSTGKWIDRAQRGVHHRGVFRLLKHLGVQYEGRL